MPKANTQPLRAGDWPQLERVLRRVDTVANTWPSRTTSANGTLASGDNLTLVDTSGGNVTLTLPSAASVLDEQFTIKKMDAANTVTITPDGSDTIDGAASLAWTTQYAAYTLQAVTLPGGGTGWVIV